ncbi:MAG: preprotein translocase subunit SecA [Oscillospiraceae bacterium]|nr:preprotein translocase subunit SecA [Oscillospiraceae bacterium]
MDKKTTIAKIKSLAQGGECSGNSLEAVFARCYLAAEKTLGITPFDEQLSAALSLTEGRMVQMQTGEGKTLCAVFAACHEALNNGAVHILTFNDYLADRDCGWMRPIYDELGVSVGCITEDTPREERAELYKKQVLYMTAKEAGFDYLRDFVRFEGGVFPEKLNFAIVDEADSILIDEARIPLVIAGDVAVKESGGVKEVYDKLADFDEDDFAVDEETRNVYLTDGGADKAEEMFGCSIYAADSAELLAKICACLKARSVLAENKDYIVKDGSVLLIDEFTGRAAPGRVFPGELQAAVEAKHDLKITSRGRIMGNIALQYFARLYPKLSGMTGTAEAAREEFEHIYGILTDVIPTRLPCARIDKPLELYYDKDEKRKAVIAAIKEAADVRRPVLVGSESIEESESIAEDLRKLGIGCKVLNAKNNAEEAAVIAKAGERGAVTISTNMAGRGVDIKLGGVDSADKDFVVSVGGLLVIATSMRESSRITKQLRGRAGRQGDVGESRFFAALDDSIMKNNDLKGLAGRHYPSAKIEGALTDKTLLREAERVQRISEGDAFDERVNLMKYTMIGEKHRETTFARRSSLLDGSYKSEMWQKNAADLYESTLERFDADELQTLQNRILAALLNEFWCDYLDYSAYLREGIHLTQVAGRNPAEEYNIACEEYYESAAATIPDRMAEKLEDVLKCDTLDDYVIDMPTRTYTYLLNDMAEEFKAKPILMGMFDDYETEAEKLSDEPAEQEEPTEKKGFFGKLFGKKK